MKVAKYIVDQLVAHGITEAFVVVGGASMHLTDAMARHPMMRVTYMHHEQACAMAAESYYRLTGRMAVVCVSSGPASWNAAAGVWGAWVDSMAMIVLAGQVKGETLNAGWVRQMGDQEADMSFLGRHTNGYFRILYPQMVSTLLPHALSMAVTGRPGPVWLEVPVDVQAADIGDHLGGAAMPTPRLPSLDRKKVEQCLERLHNSARPVILLGSGVRTSRVNQTSLLRVLERLGVPVVTAFNAHDLIPSDHPLFCGRQGTIGDRAGNFAVQSSDFLLVLGCRMNIRQVGYNWGTTAPNAYCVMVDIDPGELTKHTFYVDLPIVSGILDFIQDLDKRGEFIVPTRHQTWVRWCKARVDRYPVVPSEPKKGNPYNFIDNLFRHLHEDDIVVCGNATACIVPFQAAKIKLGQRLYSNSGAASMGWALPAAIGASRGANGRRVICIDGDGSLQMNVQELATVARNALNIRIVVLNNEGYASIQHTQANYFPDNSHGCSPETGVGFPNLRKLADAYDIGYWSAPGHSLGNFLRSATPGIWEERINPAAGFSPRVKAKMLPDGTMVSPPLDDMFPFLSETERQENLIQ